ncbi:MAG: cation transporter [Xanthomonadaceae bacterium]|jgi:copper chaperone|nr:cation transporter [Xanthomonadaceae bacterium]
MNHIEWEVSGMTCNRCVARLKNSLDNVGGIHAVHVGLEKPQVKLDFDPALTDKARIKEAIEDTGFDVVA